MFKYEIQKDWLPPMIQQVSAAQYERLRELLVEAREKSGLKQWMVANKMQVPQAWVSRVLQGHKYLDLLEFVVFCKAMQADPKEILARMLETPEGKELGNNIRELSDDDGPRRERLVVGPGPAPRPQLDPPEL
jgi:hypothetical protein